MDTHDTGVAPRRRPKGRASEHQFRFSEGHVHSSGDPSLASGAGLGRRFSDELRGILETRLFTGDCSVVAIAELFSVNRRTLSRHLNREGTAYQVMVNGLRFEIACELLTQSGMTFGQIAAALGYSELSGFTRAFRHWSGQTPTEWRSRHAHLQNEIREEG